MLRKRFLSIIYISTLVILVSISLIIYRSFMFAIEAEANLQATVLVAKSLCDYINKHKEWPLASADLEKFCNTHGYSILPSLNRVQLQYNIKLQQITRREDMGLVFSTIDPNYSSADSYVTAVYDCIAQIVSVR